MSAEGTALACGWRPHPDGKTRHILELFIFNRRYIFYSISIFHMNPVIIGIVSSIIFGLLMCIALDEDFRQRVLVSIFTFIYWNTLKEDVHGYPRRRHIVKVRGWRTFLVDSSHGRMTVTPLFKFFKWYL